MTVSTIDGKTLRFTVILRKAMGRFRRLRALPVVQVPVTGIIGLKDLRITNIG